MIKDTYGTEEPDYDKEALSEAVGSSFAILKAGGVEYLCGVPLDTYLKNGWEIEKGPEFIPSNEKADVYLRKDIHTTVVLTVINPFDQALVPRYCFVKQFQLSASDLRQGDELSLEIPGSEITLNDSTSITQATKMLADKNLRYQAEDNSVVIISASVSASNSSRIQIYFKDVHRGIDRAVVDVGSTLQSYFANHPSEAAS